MARGLQTLSYQGFETSVSDYNCKRWDSSIGIDVNFLSAKEDFSSGRAKLTQQTIHGGLCPQVFAFVLHLV